MVDQEYHHLRHRLAIRTERPPSDRPSNSKVTMRPEVALDTVPVAAVPVPN